jgi:hypothetical protein
MITESSIYWILKLDDIRTLFIVLFLLFAISSVFLVVGAISAVIDKTGYVSLLKKAAIASFTLCAIFGLALTFTPSTRQMAMIKVLPAVVNSEVVGEMSADAKEIYRMGINSIKEALSENREQIK